MGSSLSVAVDWLHFVGHFVSVTLYWLLCISYFVEQSLWDGCYSSVAVGWLLWVGRMWVVGVGHCISSCGSVALCRLGRCGFVIVSQSLYVGRFGSVAL